MVIFVIVSVALPVLVSVTCCGALVVCACCGPNASIVAETVATGAAPLSAIVCAAKAGPAAFRLLSVSVNVPLTVPVAAG